MFILVKEEKFWATWTSREPSLSSGLNGKGTRFGEFCGNHVIFFILTVYLPVPWWLGLIAFADATFLLMHIYWKLWPHSCGGKVHIGRRQIIPLSQWSNFSIGDSSSFHVCPRGWHESSLRFLAPHVTVTGNSSTLLTRWACSLHVHSLARFFLASRTVRWSSGIIFHTLTNLSIQLVLRPRKSMVLNHALVGN